PSDWTGAALEAFAPEFSADMARLFQPAEGMKTREVPGGTGPASVAKALDEAATRLDTMRRALG
ncbi:MAG: argininosuccinate lyase, partial [Bryobacteraceae bacterium]